MIVMPVITTTKQSESHSAANRVLGSSRRAASAPRDRAPARARRAAAGSG